MKKMAMTAAAASVVLAASAAAAQSTQTTTPTRPMQTAQATSAGAPPMVQTQSSSVATIPEGAPSARRVERDTVTLYQSTRPNKALLFTGGALFLGSYVPTAAITAADPGGTNADRTLYLPVVGPWMHLADRAPGDGGQALLIAGSGALQAIGLGLAITSFFVPEKVAAATIQAGGVKMNVSPVTLGKGSAGFGAVGTF